MAMELEKAKSVLVGRKIVDVLLFDEVSNGQRLFIPILRIDDTVFAVYVEPMKSRATAECYGEALRRCCVGRKITDIEEADYSSGYLLVVEDCHMPIIAVGFTEYQ